MTIKYPTWRLIKDLARSIRPYKRRFAFGSFLRLADDVVNLYPTEKSNGCKIKIADIKMEL
jgi:hypothetical protein